MEKINVIVPILEHTPFLEDHKKLLQALKKYESSELEFEVYFIVHNNFLKPKNYRNTKNVNLVLTQLHKKNELIQKGFSLIEAGSSLILELGHSNLANILEKLLKEKSDNSIVRVYRKQEKTSKFKKLVKSAILKIYELYLRIFSLQKDLLCENSFQYFNENATQVIKSMPSKNAYLRNYDALIGYEQKKIEVEKKKECVLNKKEFAVIISIISVFVGELLFITTLILTGLILPLSVGFILYILMLSGSFFLAFLGYYALVKITLESRANL